MAETPDNAHAPIEPDAPATESDAIQTEAVAAAAPAAIGPRARARPQRSPEERQADRDAERAAKARRRREGRAQARAKVRATPSGEPTPPREHVAGTQKVRQGVVISDKADKTITVRIDTARRHRRYAKIVRTSQTLHAHDERNDARTGDTVTVREARPLSRSKRWRLVSVVERAR
ncbi:MAG: 30S ribosomal protein S17 [Solirubrobacterales bacterium]|nr:30S ribosomal protein S17 [Solirubrobacterales bacterium]